MADIKSVDELLNMDLDIPDYQRPYKWGIRNVEDLISDISNSIAESERFNNKFKYRIGTIILHRNNCGSYEIVDGQQRILTLTLLKKCIAPDFSCSILELEFDNKVTQQNIKTNFTFMREWFSLNPSSRERFISAFSDILEVVVVCVDKLSEAFQLFDSQNTRGKELDPHDLLKAYHLREMKSFPYEMEHAVTKWEAKDTKAIRELFDLYLFPIWNWSRGFKSRPFTVKEIDTYKGITESSGYFYARRAGKAMPYFQITEPFIAGNDFFEMVEHYMYLLQDIMAEINTEDKFSKIKDVLKIKSSSTGFKYSKNLFFCALLCYYDKFHNFDEMAVKKLFIWALMLRVDMENLGFDSINCYAIGDENNRYTNTIAMLQRINLARKHSEISSLQIKVLPNSKKPENWSELFDKLKNIVGLLEVPNE